MRKIEGLVIKVKKAETGWNNRKQKPQVSSTRVSIPPTSSFQRAKVTMHKSFKEVVVAPPLAQLPPPPPVPTGFVVVYHQGNIGRLENARRPPMTKELWTQPMRLSLTKVFLVQI